MEGIRRGPSFVKGTHLVPDHLLIELLIVYVFSFWHFVNMVQVWARQRSSIYSHDCISGYLLSTIMAYLATVSGKNRISKSMNTIQICRHTLDFIGMS